jgi:SOS-response transcriptional repressor LexA
MPAAIQTMGERIREAREAYKLSQGNLAKRVGVSASSVSQWESDDVRGLKPTNLLATARALGVNVYWLVYGTGKMRGDSTQGTTRVPVIDWANAGSFEFCIKEGEWKEYVDVAFAPDMLLFATTIPDDSMATEIPRGSTLIIDAGIAPEPNDYVLAQHMETGDVSCRKLIRDGGRLYLKAENQAYPMNSADGFTIIGVVREIIRRFR